MQQTLVSVVMTVAPGRVAALRSALRDVRATLGGRDDSYTLLRARLPTLHFLSMVVFGDRVGVAEDLRVAPLFVLEANVDGAVGPFWAALEALAGEALRTLLRCCEPPLGDADSLFRAVTEDGARAPIAPLLDRQSVFPAARHLGNRGLSCRAILGNDALFGAAQRVLPPPADILAAGAGSLHRWLRARLRDGGASLAPVPRPRVPSGERLRDFAALGGLILVALAVAAGPWLLLARLAAPATAAAAALLVGALCLTRLRDVGELARLLDDGPRADPDRPRLPEAWWIAAVSLLAALPLTLVPAPAAAWAMLAVAGVVASVLMLMAALRTAERADPAPPDSRPDPALVRTLRDWEDRHAGGCAHMASIVVIKPGRFRAFVIRVALLALNLVVRVIAANGYLGTMRTIHFAHWAIVDQGRRLLFLSNFDGSWESYLDDFIEKSHAGLTLAWSNCEGFPPAEYVSLHGATSARRFKAWARCSMTPSEFWYAAYPALTVNQIERQAAVVDGLRRPVLAPTEAARWARLL